MSVDCNVAVRRADWPTPTALNQCMAKLHYPVSITTSSPAEMNKPLTNAPNTLGLIVSFEGKRLELEALVTKLGPGSPYAFGLRQDLPKKEGKLPDGTKYTIQSPASQGDFVPQDLNADLRKIGVQSPGYKDGDYVLTLSFRSSIPEYRAGAYLMAGLIKCARGFGFEFQGPSFGKTDFAESLARDAADPSKWK